LISINCFIKNFEDAVMMQTVLRVDALVIKVSAVSLTALMLLTGCVEPVVRQENIPATFHILSEAELHQNMQEMADRVTALAFITLDESLTPEQRRVRVIPLLESIEVSASGIDGKGAVTNYSVINRYMGAFLYDVSVARTFASREPPNLIPAQRLIKSCLSCHESM
jgi:hypothetical protein